MPTSPVLVPAGPPVPDSSNTESTFDAQWEAFNAWARDDLQPGINALGLNVKANADEANADAAATAADRVQTGLDRTAAASSASTATTKAGEASTSAAAALQSVVDAAALLDQFDDRYLGVKAADPTLDNDGNALLAGAIYVNSVSGFLRAYTGSGWVQGISSIAGVSSVNSLTGAVTGIATTADIAAERSAVATLTNKTISGASNTITADSTNAVGFRTIPQVSQSAAYTAVLTDSGKHILHPSADTTARIFTIPANASVAYPIGTAITFVNQASAGVVTIAITTDVMRLAGAGTTGSRTLAANGVATVIKLTATEWIISGSGLT